jgi:eukaryotic-like serine/threonine-protein kinase
VNGSHEGTATMTTRELADRIAVFARAVFVVAGVNLLRAVIMAVVSHRPLGVFFTEPTRVVHMVATAALLAAWRVCLRVSLPIATLRVIDVALTVSLCACWALLALGVPPREPVEITVVLAVTYTLIARSVAVPSSPRRTLWISTLSIVPGIVVIAQRSMSFIPDASSSEKRGFVLGASVWLVVAAVTAALNSRLIYGLRTQVRELGKLGQYTLETKLGEGGMGVVYRATHAMLRRPAAIKLLLPDRASAVDLARFEREVQLTSRLAHPNTVSIFDYGRTAAGVFYYVMEYIDGLDLERLVEKEGPIHPGRAIHILSQASSALAEAHSLGLVHRDIKPANIMLTERPDEPDVVKVVDFGLVKTMEGHTGDASLSNAKVLTGTPMYLAPEAITSPDAVDARADVYAMGAVAYYLLTGEHVFTAKTVIEVCSKHLHETPIPPSERLGAPLPGDLEALVLSCIAKKPAERPASAAVLRDALAACVDASRYDVAASRAWWLRHRAEPEHQPPAPLTGHEATMAIDLRARDPKVEARA